MLQTQPEFMRLEAELDKQRKALEAKHVGTKNQSIAAYERQRVEQAMQQLDATDEWKNCGTRLMVSVYTAHQKSH